MRDAPKPEAPISQPGGTTPGGSTSAPVPGAAVPPTPGAATGQRAAATTRAVTLKLRRTRGGRASCKNAGITADLRSTGTTAIKQVTFLAGARRLRTITKAPFGMRTTRRRIGRARAITARVTYADGTTQRITRRVRACR